MKVRLFGAVLVLVALVACKGGGSSSGGSSGSKIGDTVSLEDSDWVVVEAKDAGKTLKSNAANNEEKRETTGRFILVHYKVTNKLKEEKMLLDHPQIVDDKGRESGPIDKEENFVPAKTTTVALLIPPSGTKELWSVIEVAPDAKNLKLQFHGFSMLGDKKSVDLGL
jgi:hypothetical protein